MFWDSRSNNKKIRKLLLLGPAQDLQPPLEQYSENHSKTCTESNMPGYVATMNLSINNKGLSIPSNGTHYMICLALGRSLSIRVFESCKAWCESIHTKFCRQFSSPINILSINTRRFIGSCRTPFLTKTRFCDKIRTISLSLSRYIYIYILVSKDTSTIRLLTIKIWTIKFCIQYFSWF